MQSSRLVRAAFALLVLGTVAAFALTQALKTETPVVLRFAAAPIEISPDGDGTKDETEVGFDLSEPAEVSFAVIDGEGREVRRLVDEEELPGDAKHRYVWDGRDDEGEPVPHGTYRLRVVRRNESQVVDSLKTVVVDTKPPKVELVSAEPGVADPSGGEIAVRVRYEGPSTPLPEFTVWRTDDGAPRPVRRFRGDETRSGIWAGRLEHGGMAPDGDYAFQVRVRDKAGNEALAPPGRLTRRKARPGTAVSLRRLTLTGPLGVVSPGSVARLRVGPEPRRFDFTLVRLGSRREVRAGRRDGGVLRVHLPDDARTGLYVVRVRSRGRTASWPLAVAGLPPGGAAATARPLVVLPAITWQGLNPVDSDHDGFTDTLEDARAVPVERPFAAGRLPRGLLQEVAPLLRFLDRARLPYDLTTDVSLARGEGPALGNAPGIALAGSAVWLPPGVRERLRTEVEGAGKPVAIFGGETLRRTVTLEGGMLRDPTPSRPADLFGERMRAEHVEPPAPLAVERDRLALFGGVDDSLFGEFSRIVRSVRLPASARLLSAAGREPGRPTFVAYRLGDGTVVRVGTPQWARGLEQAALDVELPRITRRVWRLLEDG